jgi:zinc protease
MWWRSIASALLVISCGCLVQRIPPSPPTEPEPAREEAPASYRESMDRPTTMTSEVRAGKLDNGLAYYVMRHPSPPARAAVWLVVNAGSVLEDDDQRGLAHFVEHMAFAGTKNFPKAAIVDYLENAGMTLGPDVNAYTSFDETVYQLTIPTDDSTVVNKGLDILHDFAAGVTFDPAAVDKERNVLLEEWRLGRGASARNDEKQVPVLFRGSRYAERMPIGLPDVLKTARREALLRFYRDWYRPGLMAVVAVGDLHPAMVEFEIQRRFADLTDPPSLRPRVAAPVPYDHDLAVTTATDPEQEATFISVYDKMASRRSSTKRDYRRGLVENLYHTMLNSRLSELGDDPDSPFLSASSSTHSIARTADAFVRSAMAKESRSRQTLEALFREIARVERHGFLPSELERAKKEVVSSAERRWWKEQNVHMDAFAREITRHFLVGEQMPGRQLEAKWTRELVESIELAELNHLAKNWAGSRGRVVEISGPPTAKLPDETEIRDIVGKVVEASVPPWRDDDAERPLLARPPVPGRVVKTKQDEDAHVTEWTLANGVRVIVKATGLIRDDIEFTGWQPGGSSLVSDGEYLHAHFADTIVRACGAGDFSPAALRKALAGKVASVKVELNELSLDVSGQTRPEDLETTLQLLHLRLTAPRRDPRAFSRWRTQAVEIERNRRGSPEASFSDAITEVRTNNHLRRRPFTIDAFKRIDLDKALSVFRRRVSDLGNFTFVFVGTLDLDTLRPLVETYLGSLPAKGGHEKWRDVGVRYVTGQVTKNVVAGTEPKSRLSMTFAGDDVWSLEGERDVDILEMALELRLREVLRQQMGAIYDISISGMLQREPRPRRSFVISFECAPENVDKLRAATLSEIATIQKEGLGEIYVAKIVQQLRRRHETDSGRNSYWLHLLQATYYFGDDYAKRADFETFVKRVTTTNIRDAARRFLDDKNMLVGILRPKPAEPRM